MIEQLTEKQQQELIEYREKMFNRAVSTKTNRKKAEKWAKRLTADTLSSPEIHWCSSPQESQELSASISASLRDSVRASIRSIIRSIIWENLWDSLRDSVRDSLRDSVWASLRDSLWDSLWASLRDSVRASLRDSLWDSIRDSLRDTGWVSFFSYTETLGVEYNSEESYRLKCYRKLLKHCFAIYVIPGHIILVEKPTSVTVVDGKLTDIAFANSTSTTGDMP